MTNQIGFQGRKVWVGHDPEKALNISSTASAAATAIISKFKEHDRRIAELESQMNERINQLESKVKHLEERKSGG